MPLTVGSRLGHYDVTALIGELKILPEAFAADPDRLARYQREAYFRPGVSVGFCANGVSKQRAGAGGCGRGRSRGVTTLLRKFSDPDMLIAEHLEGEFLPGPSFLLRSGGG